MAMNWLGMTLMLRCVPETEQHDDLGLEILRARCRGIEEFSRLSYKMTLAANYTGKWTFQP